MFECSCLSQHRGLEHFGSSQIIIAALNETQGIGATIEELQKSLGSPTLLYVDGNNTDQTVEVVTDFGVNIVFQEGTGKGDAIAKAFKRMRKNVEYVVLTDADYESLADYIPAMIEILEQNPKVGMVCGNRFNGQDGSKSLNKRFYYGNRLLAFAHKRFNGVSIHDPLTGLRVIRTELLRDWAIKSKGFDIDVELNCQIKRKGLKIIEVPIKHQQRIGEKKLKTKHAIVILKRILLEAIR